jgi:hypothetical protein
MENTISNRRRNGELKRIGKGVVVAESRYYLENYLERLRKNYEESHSG